MKQVKWIGLGLLIASAFSYAQSPKVASWQGKAIPAFNMTTFAGKKISNTSLKGKVVLLDFWATWCGPCKAASPTMQALHTKYASKGLVVIGANMGEDASNMKPALNYPKEHKYTYTFTKGNDAFASKLGIEGIPCFIFIDKKGKVQSVQTGFGGAESAAEFEKIVKKLLG